ncbi:Spy/CpxP family protein refolding chaperone [Candidatus Neomarinimicrobiota bacterium]
MLKKLIPMMLIISTVVLSQPGRGFGTGRVYLSDEMNLTSEQMEKIGQLYNEYQLKHIDLQAEVQKLILQQREQIRAERPNQRNINSTIDNLAEQRKNIEKLRVEHLLSVQSILTDEQRQIFDSRPYRQAFGIGRAYNPHGSFPGRTIRRGMGRMGGNARIW